jgi:hypothetical protein
MLSNFAVQIVVIIAIGTLFASISAMLMNSPSPVPPLAAILAAGVVILTIIAGPNEGTVFTPTTTTQSTFVEIGTADSIVRDVGD